MTASSAVMLTWTWYCWCDHRITTSLEKTNFTISE